MTRATLDTPITMDFQIKTIKVCVTTTDLLNPLFFVNYERFYGHKGTWKNALSISLRPSLFCSDYVGFYCSELFMIQWWVWKENVCRECRHRVCMHAESEIKWLIIQGSGRVVFLRVFVALLCTNLLSVLWKGLCYLLRCSSIWKEYIPMERVLVHGTHKQLHLSKHIGWVGIFLALNKNLFSFTIFRN